MSANQHHLLSLTRSIGPVITVSLILFIPSTFAELDDLAPVDFMDKPNQSRNTNQSGIKTMSCSITLAEFVVYFYLQTLVCFLGVILNLINVAVFRKPQFIGDAYLYMTAMSLADAITLLANLPSGLVRCNRYFHYCHHSSFPKFRTIILYYNTYVLYPIGNISENATVWFTVLLCVERYLAMRTLEVPSRTRQGSQVTGQQPPPTSGNEASPSREPEVIPDGMPNQVPAANPLRNLNIALINRLNVCTHALQEYTSRANEGFIWMTSCWKVPAQFLIVTVTILSILFNLPMCFVQTVGYRDDGVKNSSNDNNSVTNLKLSVRLTSFGNSSHYSAFSWSRTMLVYIIPFIFLCVANACLLHFVNSAGNRRQKVLMTGPRKPLPMTSRFTEDYHPASKNRAGSRARWRSAQSKLTILLIIVIGLFLAGQIPQAFAYTTVFGALMSRFGIHCPDWQCCSPYQIYRAVTHLLSLLSYSINFFVYMFLNRHFTNQVCAWFTICYCHRHDVPQFNCPTSTASALAPPRSQQQSCTNCGLSRDVLSQYSSNAQNFESLKPGAGDNLRLVSRNVSETSPSLGKTGVKSPQRRFIPPFESLYHVDKRGLQPRLERGKSKVPYWIRNRLDQISGGFRKTRERCTLHRNLSHQMNCSKNGWNRQINHTCENSMPFRSTLRDGQMWSTESRFGQHRLDSTFSVKTDNPRLVSYGETLVEASPSTGLLQICQDADTDAISVDGSLDSRELNISTSV